MMRCNDCRALMLDHRYGLLEAAEAAVVNAHLAECSECTTAFAEAGRVQSLLGKAAKSEFPKVAFAPPVDEPAVPSTKVAKSRGIPWVQWVVAASVLLLIPGTLIPLNKLADRYESAKREAIDSATRTADARSAYERSQADRALDAQLAAAQQKHLRVVSSWVNDAKSESARRVSVEVTKPLAAQPGAPNDYVVAIADPDESLKGSRVEAQFRDQAGTVLYSQPLVAKANTPVRLPAEVWNRVSPQSEVFLSVAAVGANGARTELQEPIRLFGPIYATLLVTDKATYRPGEHLYFRSLTLDRVSFRPPSREQNLRYTLIRADGTGKALELAGSTNLVKAETAIEPVTDREGQPIRGVGCGAFVLPANLPDGEYILTLRELPGAGGASPVMAFPVTKSIRVRSGAPERYKKTITFPGGPFNPSHVATAVAELKLGDKPIAGARGTVVVASDDFTGPPVVRVEPMAKDPVGNNIAFTGLTDAEGRFRIFIPLPASLRTGNVKVMVIFKTDDAEETVAQRIPIAGKNTTIEFFPEGGKLLAGVPNHVYVRGTDSAGKPVDVHGTIAAGAEIVAKVDCPTGADEPGGHRGLGSFTFTPKPGEKYNLRLQNGNATVFDLPPAEASGVTFTALDPVVKPGQPIRVRVHSVGKARNLVVGAYTRGRLADRQTVALKADGSAVLSLLPQGDARGGVTRITVFEVPEEKGAEHVPVAERLVFRKPGEALNLTATPTGPLTAGSPVDLSIAATDEKGNPIPAILWAAAVNSAAAPGEKDRALATHFLLGGEVQSPDELEHADFLLTEHPKAAEALDHVLATQGWRRFVEQTSVAHTPAGGAAEAIHKLNGKHLVKATRDPLAEKYLAQFEATAKEVDAARSRKSEGHTAQLGLYANYEASRAATANSAEALERNAKPYEVLRNQIAVSTGIVAVLMLMLGGLALVRGMGGLGAVPYFAGAIAATGLAAYVWVDASRNPVTVTEFRTESVAPPALSLSGSTPNVALPPAPPEATTVESVPEKFHLFNREFKMPASVRIALAGGSTKPSVPNDLIDSKLSQEVSRTAPGMTVVEKFLTEEQKAQEKSQSFSDARALGILRRIESALRGSGLAADGAAERVRSATPRVRSLVVREYAAPRPGSDGIHPEADTILWQPVIVLPSDGKTTLHFHLGNAPGGYQVIVAGHTPDGRLGSTRLLVPVR